MEVGRPSRSRTAFLASAGVFGDLSKEALDAIEPDVEGVVLPAGETLFEEGDPGDSLYVILAGRIEVLLELPEGKTRTLAVLSGGDCVGEISMLDGGPRTATVRALRDSKLIRLPRAAVARLEAIHPDARARFAAFVARRLPSLHLARTELFRGLGHGLLTQFDQESNWVRLAGGRDLFRQGQDADGLYVVVHGRLEILVANESGVERVVEQIGRGACVGEMALLTDEPRSATVRAIRDSELVRVPTAGFRQLIEAHPAAATELARSLVHRLRRTTSAPSSRARISTIALLPADSEGVPPELIESLVAAFEASGSPALHVGRERLESALGPGAADVGFDDAGNSRVLDWLNVREESFPYVLYECDGRRSPWTSRCLRHADLVLIVGRSDRAPPAPGTVTVEMTTLQGDRRVAALVELLLLHPPGLERPAGTHAWLASWGVSAHHHVRLGNAGDVRRLVRMLTRSAVGLAFSGGGARGFAHIGVVKALRELGIEIDLVGGTSMGSIIAAQTAMGLSVEEMIAMNRRGFLGLKLFRDATFPLVSLFTSRRTVRMLKEMFGDARIEDLWLPYFCVTSNLTRAEMVVKDEGPLWFWIRASCSVPGIEPPVVFGGDLYVDGGVLNNLPADVARERCPGSVIAVDVSPPIDLTTRSPERVTLSSFEHVMSRLSGGGKQAIPGIGRILSRTAMLSSVRGAETTRREADLYLHPPTDHLDPLDWGSIEDVVEIGYRYAMARIAAWQRPSDAEEAWL